jgi:hypothetical protein
MLMGGTKKRLEGTRSAFPSKKKRQISLEATTVVNQYDF